MRAAHGCSRRCSCLCSVRALHKDLKLESLNDSGPGDPRASSMYLLHIHILLLQCVAAFVFLPSLIILLHVEISDIARRSRSAYAPSRSNSYSGQAPRSPNKTAHKAVTPRAPTSSSMCKTIFKRWDIRDSSITATSLHCFSSLMIAIDPYCFYGIYTPAFGGFCYAFFVFMAHVSATVLCQSVLRVMSDVVCGLKQETKRSRSLPSIIAVVSMLFVCFSLILYLVVFWLVLADSVDYTVYLFVNALEDVASVIWIAAVLLITTPWSSYKLLMELNKVAGE